MLDYLRQLNPKNSTVGRVPLIIRIAVAVGIFGFFYPIYGIPLAGFKLTAWRLSLISLSPVLLISMRELSGMKARILLWFGLVAAFLAVRAVSLFQAAEPGLGKTQILWGIEGAWFVLLAVVLSARYPAFPPFLWRAIAVIGGSVVFVLCAQYAALRAGTRLYLPLSTSRFGATEEMLTFLWNYPYYGNGRVLAGFAEPNMAGTLALYMAILFVAKAFTVQRSSRRMIPSLLLACVSLVGIVATGSKQCAVAAAIVLPLLLDRLALGRPWGRLKAWLCSGLLLGAGIAVTFDSSADAAHGLGRGGEAIEDVFGRFRTGVDEGNVTSGRSAWIEELVSSLDFRTTLVGIGEGQSRGGGHNVFLATLVETGLPGMLLLIGVYAVLLVILWLLIGRSRTPLSMALFSIAVAWILLCSFNWAQLNQGVSYPFIALCLSFAARPGLLATSEPPSNARGANRGRVL